MSDTANDEAFKGGTIIVLVILLIYTYAGSLIEGKKLLCLHESGVAVVIGLAVSGIIDLAGATEHFKSLIFDDNVFFYLVLPPIIYSAAYSLKKKNFFRNFGYISLFGILGTVVLFTFFFLITFAFNSADFLTMYNPNSDQYEPLVFTTSDMLLMSAILSSSDVVAPLSIVKYEENPKLFSLIFGEGIVNDAVAIILFQTVEKSISTKFDALEGLDAILSFFLLAIVSVLIGIAVGLVCAYFLKKCKRIMHSPIHQMATVFFFGYISYILSDLLSMSGIITLLVCGIMQTHYAWYNLSPQAKMTTTLTFQFIGFGAEAFTFTYLGLTFFAYKDQNLMWSAELIIIEFFSVFIGRFFGTFGLLFLIRVCCCKKPKLTNKETFFFWCAGLVRGAVAFALVLRLDENQVMTRNVIISTTLVLVIVTTVVFGVILPIIAKVLFKPPVRSVEDDPLTTRLLMSETDDPKKMFDNLMERKPILAISSDISPMSIQQVDEVDFQKKVTLGRRLYLFWKNLDNNYLKKFFVYNYSKERQIRIQHFYEFFLEEGQKLEEEFEESGGFLKNRFQEYGEKQKSKRDLYEPPLSPLSNKDEVIQEKSSESDEEELKFNS